MATTRVRDILLRISGDASDAQRDLRETAEQLKRFDGITAEATVDVNTTAADRKVAAFKKSVQDVGRMAEQAKVDLQTTAAETRLKQLRTNLENLQKRPTEPKIDIAIGRTVAQIERVEAQLDKLDRRRVDVDVDIDRRGVLGVGAAGVGAVGAGLVAATQGLGLFVSAASRGIPIIGGLAQLVVQLGISGAALGPVMLALVPIIGIFVLNAVVMLTGAVVALGASFLTAAAGVGVLGVALAGAFGPVVLVAIAAMARFAKILEAVKAAEDGTAQGAQRATTSLQAQAAAAAAVDAAVQGIAQAELSREQASLGVEQAELALKQFREEAELTDTSLDGLFKKFTDVSFRPESLIAAIQKSELGQQAGPGDQLQLQQLILNLRQARLSEQIAVDGVRSAHERLTAARTDEANALTQQNQALTDQNDKLGDLTDTEQKLVDVIVALKKTLTDAFRPATQKIFEGVIAFLGDLGEFAKDSRVKGGLTAIGTAIGGMFREFGRVLRQRETREAFGALARAGASLIRQLTPVFTGLFRLVTRLSVAALPFLKQVIGDVGTAIRDWADDTDKSDIEAFVRRVRRSFNIWWGIVEELWKTVKAFFGDANDSGDELAEHLRKILGRFRNWLEENPDAVADFFEDVKDYAKDMATSVASIAADLKDIVGMKEDLKEIFAGPTTSVPKKDKSFWENFRDFFLPQPTGKQHGGAVHGVGFGDIVPAMLEPGEFVLRRSVAQSIGVGRLNLLNAGNMAALGGRRSGMVIQEQHIHLPPAPGHDQLGDPRHQAAMLARELRRRGEQGIGGGGFP